MKHYKWYRYFSRKHPYGRLPVDDLSWLDDYGPGGAYRAMLANRKRLYLEWRRAGFAIGVWFSVAVLLLCVVAYYLPLLCSQILRSL